MNFYFTRKSDLLKVTLVIFLFCVVLSSNLFCSSESNDNKDVSNGTDAILQDTNSADVSVADVGDDTNLIDKFYAVSFSDNNSIAFYEREKGSSNPFYTIKTEGEVSSLEFVPDKNTIIYSDLNSKNIVFVEGVKEIKRIQSPATKPISIKYIQKINMLIIPDKDSNRIHIFDLNSMEFSSLSPMTAGGNNPVSICFDDSPLTQGLLLRLLILNYGSLNVRAYDIFDRETWGFRSEQLPTLSEPLSIVCDSQNRRLLIMNSASNNISAYGLDDLVQIPKSPFEAGKNPTFAAIHRSASLAYVANTSDDSMTIFSTKEMKAVGGISFKTGDLPHRIYVNESESRLYVVLRGSRKMVVYDIQDPLSPEKLNEITFENTPNEMIYR